MSSGKSLAFTVVFVASAAGWALYKNNANASAAPPPAPPYVSAAVADAARPPDDYRRDAALKPAAMLTFSGIKPGQVVADLVPNQGYDTRLLSKLVGPKGRVYSIVPMVGGFAPSIIRKKDEDLRAQGRAVPPLSADTMMAIADVWDYRNVTVLWEAISQFGGMFAIPEQVDAVLLSDSYHDLHNRAATSADDNPLNLVVVDRAIFNEVKNGGMVTIVDFRSAPNKGFADAAALHRSDPQSVKDEMVQAGFVLDGESDALSNASDDHSKPASDNSDRFMLRFKKPANAPIMDARPPRDVLDGTYGNTTLYGSNAPSTRWVYYHPDGLSYQEWGNNGTMTQEGKTWWDAAGRNCFLHQFPIAERGGVVCHPLVPYKRVGDAWIGDNDRLIKLDKGYEYPKPADTHPCEPLRCQPPPKADAKD
jgi:predicted methyltransferase